MNHEDIFIDYTNYKGERAWRTVQPISIWFGTTAFHTEPQWLMHALDVEKKAHRDFAMCDIHQFKRSDQ